MSNEEREFLKTKLTIYRDLYNRANVEDIKNSIIHFKINPRIESEEVFLYFKNKKVLDDFYGKFKNDIELYYGARAS